MTGSSLRIVTIGGGTGAPTIIRSLILARIRNLLAISASTDSGGKTGVIRSDERDRVIAVSDLLRNLLALLPSLHKHSVTALTDLFSYTDGRNRNLGYTIYYALLEKYDNDFEAVQHHLEQLVGVRFGGTAIPVTIDPASVCFRTRLGLEYCGEHELDRQSMSSDTVTRLWLDKPARATPQALAAIRNATHIIYCPGSLYGSILVNFLPAGVTAALKDSRATRILLTNLVSDRNQTHAFSLSDYLKVFSRYTRSRHPIDIAVIPHLSTVQFEKKHPRVAAGYAAEHSYFLGWDPAGLAKVKGVKIFPADIFSLTPRLNRIRHDPVKLSRIWKMLLSGK